MVRRTWAPSLVWCWTFQRKMSPTLMWTRSRSLAQQLGLGALAAALHAHDHVLAHEPPCHAGRRRRVTISVYGRGRHRRRGRPGRAGRRARADRRGQAGRAARPGERRQPRRPGVLVVRRAVPRRLPGAAPARRARTRSTWPGATGRAARSSTASTTRTRWAVRWARAYVEFAAGEKRGLAGRARASRSCRPSAGPSAATCARTGTATRCPASTSPGAPAPAWSSRSSPRPSRRPRPGCSPSTTGTGSTSCWSSSGAVTGVRGARARPGRRAAAASRRTATVIGRVRADRAGRRRHDRRDRRATTTSSGATGRSGSARPPASMVTGVPAYVDGRMLDIAAAAGARLVNRDRMWHYTEGVQNWDPIWPGHGIRILPGPSSMWFDALGRRLPAPCLPGYDTLGTLRHLRTTPDLAGHDHSWFILTQRIIEKEFALSGSEQNPDITAQGPAGVPARAPARQGRAGAGGRRSQRKGADFVVARRPWTNSSPKMNALTDKPLLDAARVRAARSRPATCRSPTRTARTPRSRASATRAATSATGSAASPRRTASSTPRPGPLIGVKLHVLTRKTLGGIQTDLDSRALGRRRRPDRGPVRGGRGRRVRRRRRPRLQRAGGHVPRRLPVLRPRRRPRRGRPGLTRV